MRATPFESATLAAPLGHAGVRTSASSPGSITQRIETFSACTPEAVTTISRSGSSATPCSLWYDSARARRSDGRPAFSV